MSAPAESLPRSLLLLGEQLRAEGVAVGTSELLDAFAALRHVSWVQEEHFKESLAATLAKSPEDRRIFELVYERFMFREVELAAIEAEGAQRTAEPGVGGLSGLGQQDLEMLRMRVAAALEEGSEGVMRDLARLVIAAFSGEAESSGVIGVDVQRIRRALGLRAEPARADQARQAAPQGVPRSALHRFEAMLRAELERRRARRTRKLPPSRPLSDLDRALPAGPLSDLAAIHRVLAQLRRRLATDGMQARGHRRHAHLDMRRTVRASLQTGGVPIVVKHRPQRPRRPEIYVLCDVSTSVTSASVFFLSVLHALHDAFRKMRSFVFIERISEVTDIFEGERDFKAVSERIANHAGVADVSGYTDYGRVWQELLDLIEDELHPRATLIVLGDARTNGRDPRAELFGQIAAKAGSTYWLNPEPRLYWNYGDSVISAYQQHCVAFECWTTAQLEELVRALTRQAR